MFIATKVGAPSMGTGNTLFRHEFLEILVRIAAAKYKETGRARSYSQALRMMVESIITNYETRPWQEFRDDSLWNLEVDAVFKANLDLLQKLHATVFPKYSGAG